MVRHEKEDLEVRRRGGHSSGEQRRPLEKARRFSDLASRRKKKNEKEVCREGKKRDRDRGEQEVGEDEKDFSIRR
jgi:hypothetical protein